MMGDSSNLIDAISEFTKSLNRFNDMIDTPVMRCFICKTIGGNVNFEVDPDAPGEENLCVWCKHKLLGG